MNEPINGASQASALELYDDIQVCIFKTAAIVRTFVSALDGESDQMADADASFLAMTTTDLLREAGEKIELLHEKCAAAQALLRDCRIAAKASIDDPCNERSFAVQLLRRIDDAIADPTPPPT